MESKEPKVAKKEEPKVNYVTRTKALLTEAQEALTLHLKTEEGSMMAGWVNQAKIKLEMAQQALKLL
jgi:hypothetical protein